jgi:hypothetical protein
MVVESVPTREVRWFAEGSLADEYRRWYMQQEASLPATVEAARVDRYVRLPANDYVSVKAREGKLEVKQRTSEYQLQAWPGGATGRCASWNKTVFEPGDGDHEEWSGWQSIRKARIVRKFRFEHGRVVGIGSELPIPVGCTFELTQAASSTSIAFEAFGPLHELGSVFNATTSYVFERSGPAPLASKDSADYPAWISGQVADWDSLDNRAS